MESVYDFRKAVKRMFPHLTIKIKTVGFFGKTQQCLKVIGDRNGEELQIVNRLAREADILPDGNVRFYN